MKPWRKLGPLRGNVLFSELLKNAPNTGKAAFSVDTDVPADTLTDRRAEPKQRRFTISIINVTLAHA